MYYLKKKKKYKEITKIIINFTLLIISLSLLWSPCCHLSNLFTKVKPLEINIELLYSFWNPRHISVSAAVHQEVWWLTPNCIWNLITYFSLYYHFPNLLIQFNISFWVLLYSDTSTCMTGRDSYWPLLSPPHPVYTATQVISLIYEAYISRLLKNVLIAYKTLHNPACT